MGKVNGCVKGKRKEREACAFLTSMKLPCERNARNGLSTSDLRPLCPELERVHVEVKANRSIRLGTKALYDAYDQAVAEAVKSGKVPVVLWWDHPGWRLTWRENGELLTTCCCVGAVIHRLATPT